MKPKESLPILMIYSLWIIEFLTLCLLSSVNHSLLRTSKSFICQCFVCVCVCVKLLYRMPITMKPTGSLKTQIQNVLKATYVKLNNGLNT